MNDIQVANAPCSWGTLEFEGFGAERIEYRQMLDELVEAGYTGTELGDWGFMPTEARELKQEIKDRNLDMLASWVSVAFKNPDAHPAGEAQALKVARLLVAVAGINQSDHQPLIVLGDDNGTDPVRTENAGRIAPEMALADDDCKVFVRGVERIARAVREKTGLRTVFHPHCAGYVETADEIDRFLELSDPNLVGIVFDTGHCAYAAGSNDPDSVLRDLNRFANRIWYMHFKDCHPNIASQARSEQWDYFEALRRGIFCELGQGLVDFRVVHDWLKDHDYRGWIVVEQDVLPGMGAPKDSAKRNRDFLKTIGL